MATKQETKKAAAETAEREADFRTQCVEALNKAYDNADSPKAAIAAGWKAVERIIRKADSPEDKRDAARAYVALLDRTHGGMTEDAAAAAVEHAKQAVKDATGVLSDVKAAIAARERLARFLLTQDMADTEVASIVGVSVGRVRQWKATDKLMRTAREAGQPISREHAAEIVRAGKVKAAGEALKAKTPVLAVLDSTPDDTPESTPEDTPESTPDATWSERLSAAAAELLTVTRGDISAEPADVDTLRAVLAEIDAARANVEHVLTFLADGKQYSATA